MEILTVKDLHRITKEAISNGYGDKKIYITSDDEGNDIHPLFFGLTADDDNDGYASYGWDVDDTDFIILG